MGRNASPTKTFKTFKLYFASPASTEIRQPPPGYLDNGQTTIASRFFRPNCWESFDPVAEAKPKVPEKIGQLQQHRGKRLGRRGESFKPGVLSAVLT